MSLNSSLGSLENCLVFQFVIQNVNLTVFRHEGSDLCVTWSVG